MKNFNKPYTRVTKTMKSFVSIKQRIVAAVTATFMLLQICLPAAVAAATLVGNDRISNAMTSPQFRPSTKNGYLYEQATYSDSQFTNSKNITSFQAELFAAKLNVGAPTFIPIAGDITIFIPTYPVGKLIGDNYVQNRYIRQQITDLLGRHLIDAATDTDEVTQINRLYNNAKTFAITKSSLYKYGDNLPAAEVIALDMIWPERRTINGVQVMVPIVYLSPATVNKFSINDHKIEFLGGLAEFETITLNHASLVSGINTLIKTKGDLKSTNSTISSEGDLNLVVGGTLNNLSSTIAAAKNISIVAGQLNNKTLLQPFTDRFGAGTRLGRVSTIDAAGNITVNSANNIAFEGATATATNGAIKLVAGGNISIAPVFPSYQRVYKDGQWQVQYSSLDVIGSSIKAQDTISLSAAGAIQISASQLISSKGGIELLAQQGIYVLDELGNTQVYKKDKIGRKTGTESDFKSWAIRSVLDAGKNILLYTESGDITLKGAKITSTEGTQVTAKNGKVHLLVTKEQSQHYLNTVRKGSWTIKTVDDTKIVEKGIPNAIIGGFAVEALSGIDVEYTGIDMKANPNATLKDQIEEFRKIPELKWMADLYDSKIQKVDWDQVELVYKDIRKYKSNLSPAAMAIIAIIVCVCTAGAGAALAGAVSTSVSAAAAAGVSAATAATIGSAVGTAVAAGAVTLATGAAQSLAAGNNLRETVNAMDSDESLKSLAVSMVTAGAMSALKVEGLTPFDEKTGVGNFSNQAYQAVVSSTVRAGVSVTINGGNSDDYLNAFKTNLATYAINTIGQKLSDKITMSTSLTEASKYISHAAMGCLTSGLTNKLSDEDFKNACISGAGGAVIAQATADLLSAKATEVNGQILHAPQTITPNNIGSTLGYLGANGVDISKLLAGITAFALGGDVNAAASGAGMTAQSYRDSLQAVAQIGSLMHGMGMIGCTSNDVVLCGASAVEMELRSGLKALDYSAEAIEAEATAQRNLGLFKSIGEFNKLYLSDNVLTDMAGKETTASYSDEELIIAKQRMSALSTKIVEYTGKANIRIEQAGDIAKDAIKVTLDKPILVPLKTTIAYTAKKGAEIAKAAIDAIPGAAEALDAKEKLEEGIGIGANAYLSGNSYGGVDEAHHDLKNKDELETHSAKAITWIVVTAIGVAASAYGVYKHLDVGKDKFDGDKIVDIGSWGEKRLTSKQGTLKGDPEKPHGDLQQMEGIRLQNEAAETLSKHGLDIEMLKSVNTSGVKNPDLKINGVEADVYSPESGAIGTIGKGIKGKVETEQASVIVVNLDRSKGSFTADDVYKNISEWPVANLKSLYVIKNGVVYKKDY